MSITDSIKKATKKVLEKAATSLIKNSGDGNKRQTNRDFAKSNNDFIFACREVGLAPTGAQASKWRRKTGLAYLVVKSGRKIEDVCCGPVKQVNVK